MVNGNKYLARIKKSPIYGRFKKLITICGNCDTKLIFYDGYKFATGWQLVSSGFYPRGRCKGCNKLFSVPDYIEKETLNEQYK